MKVSENEFARFRKTLGAAIQRIRNESGLTQEELAAKAGIDRVAVGYIEQGIRAARLRTLLSLAHALDCKLSRFFQD